jgi:hypothetical protein
MSRFGKMFSKDKDNPETEQDLPDDEEELPQAFQLEPSTKDAAPAIPDPAGDAPPEEQPDPPAGAEGASADQKDEQEQPDNAEEKAESKEDELLALFGTAAHQKVELEALTSDVEDVPVAELLADLQSIAAALRRGSPASQEGRREEAA